MLGTGFKESVADSIIFDYFGFRLQASGYRLQDVRECLGVF